MHRPAPVALALAVGLALCALAFAQAATALPRGPLHTDGRWIKDASGRTIMFHGLELARKTPPYHAPAGGFTWRDARNIERWGFNAVRLGWFWKGLEPRRGEIDHGYVAELRREGRLLARHNVFTLLEAHQDGYNESVGGGGFPDWATIGGGSPGEGGLLDVAAWEPFDNLYANARGIGGAFARAWRVMAAAFERNPLMLGYDLINEPHPGSATPACLLPSGCPDFDRGALTDLQERLAAAVHAADPRAITFYEPHIYFDIGAPSWLGPPRHGRARSGFAFHDYCVTGLLAADPDRKSDAPDYAGCARLDATTFANALRTAAAIGVPPLFDEFGDTEDLADIERVVELADRNLTGWIYWAYKDWVDNPGGQGSGSLFADSDHDGTLRRAKLAVLSRPYPMATAGTPLSLRYDRARRTLSYSYAADRSVHAPTVIYTGPRQYPNGYAASVHGARIVSRPGARYLLLRGGRRARRVTVRLRPAHGRPPGAGGRRRADPSERSHSRRSRPTPSLRLRGARPATPRAGSLGTAAVSCDANAGRPLRVRAPRRVDRGLGRVIVRVRTAGGSGEVSAADGVSIAYAGGDSAWLDLGAVGAGRRATASVICRSGRSEHRLAFAYAPTAPARFSGRSTRVANTSLAGSRLVFRVPRSGRYGAAIDVAGGAIMVGLRRSDGSTRRARSYSRPGLQDLGPLKRGWASIDVVPLPGAAARWTITVAASGRR